MTSRDLFSGRAGIPEVRWALRGAAPKRAIRGAIQGLLEDYAHYRRGEAASVSPAVAEITGRPATDVMHFARDYAQAFAA